MGLTPLLGDRAIRPAVGIDYTQTALALATVLTSGLALAMSSCDASRVTRDQALKAVKKAADARVRAERALKAAELAEERAVQDAWRVIGDGRGSASVIAKPAQRTAEHIRKIVRPEFKRGHYAATSES